MNIKSRSKQMPRNEGYQKKKKIKKEIILNTSQMHPQAPPNQKVKVILWKRKITCGTDYLVIDKAGDRNYPNATSISLCGSKRKQRITSNSNLMNAVFYRGTDDSTGARFSFRIDL